MGITETIVSTVFALIEVLLSLRFAFRFFDLNVHAPVVSWIYGATGSLISPFVGILSNIHLGQFMIESATLIALIVYTVVGRLLLQLFPLNRAR